MAVRSIVYRGLVLSLLIAGCAQAQAAPFSSEDLVAALEAGGATVEGGEEIEQAFFSVTGSVFRVDGVDVQVFEYGDESARQADSDQISPDGGSIGTTMVTWIDQPNFWAKGRLIVLYVGREAALIDKLSGILGDPITEPWPAQG